MNKEQALIRLRSLKVDFFKYGPQKDVAALEYAINELEKTAQEVPVQEQSNGLKKYHDQYPTEITFITGLSPFRKLGIEGHKKCDEAIKVNIIIDSPLYNKSEVLKSLNEAFNRILINYN